MSTDARITQQYIEVGVISTSVTSYITQQYIEVGVTDAIPSSAYITQQYIEVGVEIVEVPTPTPTATSRRNNSFIKSRRLNKRRLRRTYNL